MEQEKQLKMYREQLKDEFKIDYKSVKDQETLIFLYEVFCGFYANKKAWAEGFSTPRTCPAPPKTDQEWKEKNLNSKLKLPHTPWFRSKIKC